MELVALIVKPGAFPEVETFPSIPAILRRLGIKGDIWETHTLNEGEPPYNGIGVITHDQDESKNRRENILDMRGAFALIGMYRNEDMTLTSFTSLLPEQIDIIKRLLDRAVVFQTLAPPYARRRPNKHG